MSGEIIVDSVHGDIHLRAEEKRLLDTPTFQRLRRIKQLQMSHLTYPNATHTRFSHSLGVLAIMGKVLDIAKVELGIDDDQERLLRIAALLHDIGHYPYSHLVEGVDRVKLAEEFCRDESVDEEMSLGSKGLAPYPDHEKLGTEELLHRSDIADILGTPETIAKVGQYISSSSTDTRVLTTLLHSSLDMDRLDYLKRDSQATGIPHGNVDSNYILNNLRISQNKVLGVAEKALPAAEQFLLARYFMHRTVYFHKTTYGFEEACRQLIRRLRDRGHTDIPKDSEQVRQYARSEKWLQFDDSYIDRIVNQVSEDPRASVERCLALCIRNRRPPVMLQECHSLVKNDGKLDQGYHFLEWNCKANLKSLADRKGLPVGRFMPVELKALRLEPRGPQVSATGRESVNEEKEREMIRVFCGSDMEPRFLVDIPYSIPHAMDGAELRTRRLYFVPDPGDDRKNQEKLRDDLFAATESWSTAL